MSTELEAAVKELEAVVAPATEAPIEKSLIDRLTDMSSKLVAVVSRLAPGAEGRLSKAMAHEGKETPEEEALEEEERKKKEGEGAEKSAARTVSGHETLSKSLDESASYQEVVEASQALRDLQMGVSKSIKQIEDNTMTRLARIEKSLGTLADAMAVLCTAQATIKKSLDAQPVSKPMPGFLGDMSKGGNGDEKATKKDRYQIGLALERIVTEGKANPLILSKFDTQPNVALSMLSPEIRKSYGIPDSL